MFDHLNVLRRSYLGEKKPRNFPALLLNFSVKKCRSLGFKSVGVLKLVELVELLY